MLAGILQRVYLMTYILKFSIVHHYFCWNVPSSDTNKHKENMLEKHIHVLPSSCRDIAILHYQDMCLPPRPPKKERQ